MKTTVLFLIALVAFTVPVPEASWAVPAGDVAKIETAMPEKPRAKPAARRRILVFSLCRGFRHESIPYGVKALEVMGEKTGAFEVVVSDDPEVFRSRNLSKFDAVVFNNTTGELFMPPDFEKLTKSRQAEARERDAELKKSFLDFVRSGKGVVGIHAATDTFYMWEDFGRLMGGYFNGHPWNENVSVKLEDPGHALLKAFEGKGFDVADEIYTFKGPYSRDSLKILLSLDRNKTSHKGNRADDDYALSWIREYGEGRVFYFAFGHRNPIFWNRALLQFLLDGIQYAIGDIAADATASGTTDVDIWMGEYSGTYESGAGVKSRASAKVFPTGEGRYAVTLERGEDVTTLDGRMDGRKLKLSSATSDGYIVEWEVAGPFARSGSDGKSLFGLEFPPEDPAAGDVKWRKVPDSGIQEKKIVDLGKVVGGTDVVAYLKARVWSEKVQKAELAIGSDDGVKVWLNGDLVHSNDVMRGLEPGQDRVAVRLRKEWNSLVLKVNQGGGGWAACVKVEPLDGGALKGVTGSRKAEGGLSGEVTATAVTIRQEGAGEFSLNRIERSSTTLGRKPPSGAVVLIPQVDGEPSLEEWVNPRWDALPGGIMRCGKGDNRTRREFGDIEMHVEFMIPYEPEGRGQGRGNSGVYFQDRYEVQVLDSFGLPAMDNGCGGIYKTAIPKSNASLPPLQWQTYDVVFRAPRLDANGEVTSNARISVRHNGILIHDDVEIPKPTGGAASMSPSRKAPLRLQDHGHPVNYRNMWLVEN